jgi:hypothetical protein
LLLSWRHTGFSVHNRVTVEPEDQPAVERLARYIMRPPISLERMAWDGVGEVRYRRKGGHEGAGLPVELIATSRSRVVSVTFQTTPIPPSPIFSIRR